MRPWLALAVAALLSVPTPALSAIYKWVDANGTITIRDTPPPDGVKATVVNPTPSFTGTLATPAKAERTAAPARQPAPAAVAPPRPSRSYPKVELYTTSWCHYCNEAKKFMRANGVPFLEYDVEKDAAAAKRKAAMAGRGGVPFAVIGEARIHGYAPEAYARALGIDR